MALALDRIIRTAVTIANTTTETVQADIGHYIFLSAAPRGGQPTYTPESPVTRNAIVEYGQKPRQLSSGQIVMTKCKLAFLGSVSIGPRDRLVLPNGESGPIVDIAGLLDPSTGRPFNTEVWLGV